MYKCCVFVQQVAWGAWTAAVWAPEAQKAPNVAKKGRQIVCRHTREGRGSCCKTLQSTRGPEAETLAHDQAKVEGSHVNKHPFSYLLLAANVDATHPSTQKKVRKRPL